MNEAYYRDAIAMIDAMSDEECAAIREKLDSRAAHPANTGEARAYVLMPERLTAENGAKGALSGEFVESITVTCHECEGVGEVDDGHKCAECDGEGAVEQRVMVEWDTIKRIYARAVALLAAPSPVGGSAPMNAAGFFAEARRLGCKFTDEQRAELLSAPDLVGGSACQWPSCQPEAVQQQVANQAYRELYSGESGGGSAPMSCGACGGTGKYAPDSTDECEECKGTGTVTATTREWQ